MRLIIESKAPLEGIKKAMEGVKTIVETQTKKNKLDYCFEYIIEEGNGFVIVDMPGVKTKSRILVWQFKTALKTMLKQNGHDCKITVER